MVEGNIHSLIARYQAVQLDGEGQGGYFVIDFLRLSPNVFSVINTPVLELSQIPNGKNLVKSKNGSRD